MRHNITFSRSLGLIFLAAGVCFAQEEVDPPAPAAPAGAAQPAPPVQTSPAQAPPVQAPEDKRIFGVIPNNRTTESSIPFAPITAKQKLTIAAKDSFDWPVYPTAGLFAALYQIEGQNPSFGQGMAGYAKRFGTAYGDQMIGNIMTEGLIPALGHQDPRYFRLGEGTKKSRAWYAVTQIFVARMDSGHKSFNFSEWGGNAIAAGLANAYYPDDRSWQESLERLTVACATDAFSNVLKEFWPDVKQRLFHRHPDQQAPDGR